MAPSLRPLLALSDTTVMSSISTDCPLDEHVRTQLPYAQARQERSLAALLYPSGLWLVRSRRCSPWRRSSLPTRVPAVAATSMVGGSPLCNKAARLGAKGMVLERQRVASVRRRQLVAAAQT